MKIKKLIYAVVILMFCTGIATATPLNGGFETGDLTGWSIFSLTGDVTVDVEVTAADGTIYTATEGEYFALLQGTSIMWQGVSWEAGSVLSFDWAFLAGDELPNDDIAFSVIVNGTHDIIPLASVADVGDYGDTGWQAYVSDPFVDSGEGYIVFSVADRGACNTFCNMSTLLVDNIAAAPVPEPTTMLLSALGLIGFGGWSLRKKKK